MDAVSLSACATCSAVPAQPCQTPSRKRLATYHSARRRHADTLAALTSGAMIAAMVTDPAMRARVRKALVAVAQAETENAPAAAGGW